jgi:hypothetical protein
MWMPWFSSSGCANTDCEERETILPLGLPADMKDTWFLAEGLRLALSWEEAHESTGSARQ